MLVIRPIELADANAFVAKHHRHHKPVQGHRFSIACHADERLCGVAIVGRPVARKADTGAALEVTRLCTDGTAHACSKLYSAAARIGREMGYERIQTYILETEVGVSLKAAGWQDEGPAGGGQWNHTGESPLLFSGPNRRTDQPTCGKRRWAKTLASPLPRPAAEETA